MIEKSQHNKPPAISSSKQIPLTENVNLNIMVFLSTSTSRMGQELVPTTCPVGLDSNKHTTVTFDSLLNLELVEQGDNVKRFKPFDKTRTSGLMGANLRIKK